MSIIISQEIRGQQNVYHVKHLDEAGVPVSDKTFTTGVEIRTIFYSDATLGIIKEIKKGEHKGGTVVVCVLDENGIVDEDIFNYINDLRVAESLKTKKAMGYALGTYKMFMTMNGYDYKHPNYHQIQEYSNFLTGRTVLPEPGHKVTYRSASTCNIYMSLTKVFLLLTHNDCSAFQEIEYNKPRKILYTDIYGRTRVMNSGRNPHYIRRDPLDGKSLPAHPKPEQVKQMLQMAKADKNPAIYWCINTQFRTGIRCGGLLGLTREDICEEHDGDNVEYYIYIRNRTSDRTFQYAKGLYHPLSTDEYQTSAYGESNLKRPISKRLYDGLINYYETSRNEKIVGAKKRRLILENTKADSVLKGHEPNYYVFTQPNGHLLTDQTYNNHLKPLFAACGVTLDKGYKKYNCSHQLRSAFIMFRGRYSKNPKGLLELATDAGHASPSSTMRYYNEFPEDVKKRWDDFDAELDELIPDNDNVIIESEDE